MNGSSSRPSRTEPHAAEGAEMRLTYDPHADALALTISSAEIADTVEAAPNVILDLDAAGGIVAIEVLGVTRRPGPEPLALAFEILGHGEVREVEEPAAAAE